MWLSFWKTHILLRLGSLENLIRMRLYNKNGLSKLFFFSFLWCFAVREPTNQSTVSVCVYLRVTEENGGRTKKLIYTFHSFYNGGRSHEIRFWSVCYEIKPSIVLFCSTTPKNIILMIIMMVEMENSWMLHTAFSSNQFK